MKQKTPNIGADARAQIAATLPNAMQKAINDYHSFVDEADEKKADEFKNRQMAAKAGLAHIELLIKLSVLVDTGGDTQSNHIAELLAEAQKELEGRHEQ